MKDYHCIRLIGYLLIPISLWTAVIVLCFSILVEAGEQ